MGLAARANTAEPRESMDPVRYLPDPVIRLGIRRLLQQRLDEIEASNPEAASRRLSAFIEMLHHAPVAAVPEKANEQHYEIPAAFYTKVLGAHLKYSSCHWSETTSTLDEAEAEALTISCQRARLEDGQRVLELGCGWGSLSLWMAEHYPESRITSVSNSASQKEFILDRAKERGLTNLQVVTKDMNEFHPEGRFDRIVSIEMFEHMRNWPTLFSRVADWLQDDGLFFMHVFCHRSTPYLFEDRGPSDWMSRHFFSGGIMPSRDLPLRFPHSLRVEDQWCWSGRHYEKTARAWLDRMDASRKELFPVLQSVYGEAEAPRWWMRWRLFFMACEELFGYRQGCEWMVAHTLLGRGPQAGKSVS